MAEISAELGLPDEGQEFDYAATTAWCYLGPGLAISEPRVLEWGPGERTIPEPRTGWQTGHQPGELCFWLALTAQRHTSALWLADQIKTWDPAPYSREVREHGYEEAAGELPGPVRMYPATLAPGDLLAFDGFHRVHAQMENHEGQTEMLCLVPNDGEEPRWITAEEGAAIVEATKAPLRLSGTRWDGPGEVHRALVWWAVEAKRIDEGTKRTDQDTGLPMVLGEFWRRV